VLFRSIADDPLAAEISWTSGTFEADVADFVLKAIRAKSRSFVFDRVALEVEGDGYGIVQNVPTVVFPDVELATTPELEVDLELFATVEGTYELTLLLVSETGIYVAEEKLFLTVE